MEAQEYLETRLEDQIKYHSRKSRVNRKCYYSFKTIQILISAVIPFLTGYLNGQDWMKYMIGILGVLLALAGGLEVLFKFQEKWISDRTTSESLKQEKFLFLSKAGPYKDDASLSNLSERVELILSKENATWSQLLNKKEEKKP